MVLDSDKEEPMRHNDGARRDEAFRAFERPGTWTGIARGDPEDEHANASTRRHISLRCNSFMTTFQPGADSI